jgi:hypothetical protein
MRANGLMRNPIFILHIFLHKAADFGQADRAFRAKLITRPA